MKRERVIEKRWIMINRLFLILGVAMLATVLLREFLLFRQNINFFNDQLYENSMNELVQEVGNKVKQIESSRLSVNNTFLEEIQNHVELIDYFAMHRCSGMIDSPTLEEKQENYIDTMLHYNETHDDMLIFVFDLEGVLYLSGLSKDLEGTNMLDRQDVVTGEYFFREFIEMVTTSPTGGGFVSYHWIREVNGEHIEKTSYVYYNPDVELVVATGMYEIDYREKVQETLFDEFASYYTEDDYVYVIGYDGTILYHPRSDFDTNKLLGLETTDGNYFHNYIVETLKTNDDVIVSYDYDLDGYENLKTGYIRKVEGWDIYIGRSLVEQDLAFLSREYIGDILPGFIIYNISMIALFLGFAIVIRLLIYSNFNDVEYMFTIKNDEIKDLSYRDQLTRLYNRQMFVDLMPEFTGYEDPIALIMLDANGLKLINDTYGHKMGDELLVKISECLQDTFKASYIFRWGGDEFVVVIKDASDNYVVSQIDIFREKIEKQSVSGYKISAAIGYAIDIATEKNIYEILGQAEKMMYDEKTRQSLDVKRGMIDHLLHKLYDVDCVEKNHSNNVVKYSLLIGGELDLSAEDLNTLRLSALLHDVGKIGIPQEILLKEDILNKDEFEQIRNHTEKGFRILSSYTSLTKYAPYVLNHHEWYNGQGYPQGLKGDDIPLFSRIITIADAFDAMVSERTYHVKKDYDEAMEELSILSGIQFDPKLVKIFQAVLSKESFLEMETE